MTNAKARQAASLAQLQALGREILTGDDGSETDLLLCRACGISRASLIAFAEREIDVNTGQQFLDWIEQRRQGVPIAYLLGQRDFWTLNLLVSPAVLIPRPETEHLVEQALAVLPDRPARIIDPGTGSGAVALALASERPNDQILALDSSREALAVAASNRARLKLGQVSLLNSNWLAAVAERPDWDLIASNPPYVAAADTHLDRGDCRFEPRQALTDFSHGLAAIELLCQQAWNRLRPGGWLLLEHGHDQSAAVRHCLQRQGYCQVRSWPDLAGIERITQGQR